MTLQKVKQVWYDPEAKTFESGIVLQLENDTLIRHYQDGFIVPMAEDKKTTVPKITNHFMTPKPKPNETPIR
jgi:hypothetical protein